MSLEFRVLQEEELAAAIPGVAALRISVFRDFPYLYDGDSAYEERYLAPYVSTPGAVLVGAFDGERLVGAATGMPLTAHSEDFAEAFADAGIAMEEIFYCAESVLLPEYRGQGAGHAFFDLREDAANAKGFEISAFCAVLRPADHPMRPHGYRPLDPFWRARGYAPLPGVVARFAWKDVGDALESRKALQFWSRRL